MSEQFGPWPLGARIGSGGLGEVFEVENTSQKLALKRLSREHLASRPHRLRFAQEIEVMAQLEHPQLLTAINSGGVKTSKHHPSGVSLLKEAESWPFFTSRLATGSLADLQWPQPPANVAVLAVQLGVALGAMHEQGFTHCDLSSSNILLLDDVACLSDFGAANQLGRPQAQPQGTYSCMSPEQVRGQVLHAQSDLFALATLLWQCLTGERIFWRDSQHMCFMAVVEDDPPEMPSSLQHVQQTLGAALNKDPTKRPTDVQAFCAELADKLCRQAQPNQLNLV